MSTHNPPRHRSRAMFENMPQMSDEAVWDLLELLHGLIDVYEDHYAVELQRLRNQRYNELIAEQQRHQIPLPLPQIGGDDPF